MVVKRLSNEFLGKILDDAVWKELSRSFQWTEQTLEKYKDKVNWEEVSGNVEIFWTPIMLDKFKHRLDWTKISSTSNPILLNVSNIEKFKDYWDWSELSGNRSLDLCFELIDMFVDQWDWTELINRYTGDVFDAFYSNDMQHIYSFEFLEKYLDKIPSDTLQSSRLWDKLVGIRKNEMTYKIVSGD